jgi:hypothetical protein
MYNIRSCDAGGSTTSVGLAFISINVFERGTLTLNSYVQALITRLEQLKAVKARISLSPPVANSDVPGDLDQSLEPMVISDSFALADDHP